MTYLQNPKIDNLAADGLLGVEDSLAYKIAEVEKHFHNWERWIGLAAIPDTPQALRGRASYTSIAARRGSYGRCPGINEFCLHTSPVSRQFQNFAEWSPGFASV